MPNTYTFLTTNLTHIVQFTRACLVYSKDVLCFSFLFLLAGLLAALVCCHLFAFTISLACSPPAVRLSVCLSVGLPACLFVCLFHPGSAGEGGNKPHVHLQPIDRPHHPGPLLPVMGEVCYYDYIVVIAIDIIVSSNFRENPSHSSGV